VKKILMKLLIGSFLVAILPVSSVANGSLLNAAGTKDGGIGNSTNFLDSVPNIAIDPKVNEIIYPLFATPAIKQKGQTLTVKVDSKGAVAGAWDVKLKQTAHSALTTEYSLPVQKAVESDSYWKKSGTIYEVTVQIPDNVPEKLYDLEVSFTGNGKRVSDEQPHSVKVVDQFKKDFTFLHLTDTHVGSPRNLGDPDDPSGVEPAIAKEAGMWDPDESKRWLYLQKAIKEVNLSNPDFVVVTGDMMYGQMNPQEYIYEYEETYRVLQKLNVPVFIVPGNHDYYAQDATLADGAKYWEQYFGPQYFSFDYGPYAHYIGYNSFDWHKFDRSGTGTVSVPTWGGQIREEQLNWIKGDLAANAKTAKPSQIKGLFSHHNPLWRDRDIWPQSDPEVQSYWKQYDAKHNPRSLTTLLLGEKLGIKYDQQWHGENAQELTDVMKQFNVNLSLHGHTHTDDVTEKDGILYTTTTAIELTGKPWVGFRNFKVKNGEVTSHKYDDQGHSTPVYQNGDTKSGVMSFEASYSLPNNGQASSQEATVTNRLEKPITVTVPFYMTAGSYQASSGTVKQNYSDGEKQYLEIELTVPANSGETIKIGK
jgi:3',5'-cyclic AMP phosphodiesterase CpdA